MTELREPPSNPPKVAVWKAKIDSQGSYHLERVDLLPAPQSLDQALQMLPPGVYTTFRTFDGDKILSLIEQVNRLEESASLVGQPVQIKIEPLRKILRETVCRYPSQEKRVRLSVDLGSGGGCVYVFVEMLQPPRSLDYSRGVIVVTFRHKRQNPRAKQTQFIEVANSIRKSISGDVEDILMVDEGGLILEGLNSNFFAVQQGEVFTAGEKVLSGITREMVLKTIRQMEIPFHLSPIHVNDLDKLDEAFLTSASRSILPVAQIDEFKIGGLIPGPITAVITDAYWKNVTAGLEDI